MFNLRPATLDEVPQLQELIAVSARGLGRNHYSPEQIELALGSAWGVDTQLIRDDTYFSVESGGQLVGCGGWSKRGALFGADALTRKEPHLLNPETDAARIRAFFVHPRFARHGIGRMILEHCEAAARSAGFARAELMATLPGERLYSVCGYSAVENVDHPLGTGLTIRFVRMRKDQL